MTVDRAAFQQGIQAFGLLNPIGPSALRAGPSQFTGALFA